MTMRRLTLALLILASLLFAVAASTSAAALGEFRDPDGFSLADRVSLGVSALGGGGGGVDLMWRFMR